MKKRRIRMVNRTSKTCKNKMLLILKRKCVAELRRKYYFFNLGNTNKHLLVSYTMTDDYVQYHINGIV